MSLLGDTPISSSRRPSPSGFSRWWPYAAVAGLFWVVPGAALLVAYLTLPDYNASGQCEGIGFGCVPTPKVGTQLVAMFIYPFVVVAGLLIMGVIAITRRQRGWLILFTAMVVALIFGLVFARVTSQAVSVVLVVVGVGLVLVLPATLQRWRREPSR